MTLRSNHSHLFGADMLPVLEEIFRSELPLHPMVRDQLFKTVKTDRDIWQSSEIHDMPLYSQVAEGTDYSYTRPKQGAPKTIEPKKWGLGFSISEEAIDDGKFDFVADAVRKMAESAMETKEVNGINIFNNAFTTATTADGIALCSASHTLPSGLTMRNKLSTDADLSPSSLKTAITDFETQFISDNGKILRLVPRKLLVHSSNRLYAKEILGSELLADTANNNMNSLKDEGISVVSSARLTDQDAWFLLAAAVDTGLRVIDRKGVETKSEEDFDRDIIKYKARFREEVGATHPYGVFGTTGA